MSVLQDTYTDTQPALIEGQVANMEKSNIISMAIETAAGVGFGKVVVQGTGDTQVRASEAGQAFRGITVLDLTQVSATADIYPQNCTAAVMTMGVIAVTAAAAVNAGDPAFYDPATGDLSSAAAGTEIGVWDSSAAAGSLARLRLNLN